MGNIKQCSRCRQLFQSLGSDVCPDCAQEIDQQFLVVKDFLYDHPDAKIMEIVQGTNVDEKLVLNFLREGRLSVSQPEDMLTCIECGEPITTGRYCARCQEKLEGLLKSAYHLQAASQGKRKDVGKNIGSGRMHVHYGEK